MPNWWDNGNTLALVDVIRKKARVLDDAFEGEAHSTVNSHLIGLARVLGVPETDVQDAFASDRNLTIYEP